MAGPTPRGPLYVTTPTKRGWTQPDLPRNVAVALSAAAVALHPLVEPTFYKKPAQQIEVSRNTPALAQAPPALVIQQQADPYYYPRPKPQPDVYNNIAAQFPLVTTIQPLQRAPLYVNTNYRQWTQPDVLPNIASTVFPLVGLLSHWPEPTFYPRPPPQIDVIFNVATALVPAIGNISVFDNLPPYVWKQPDIFPNIAVGFPTVFYEPPAPIDPPPPRRYFTQIDLYPNVALKGIEPPRPIPSLDWVLPAKKWPTPDVLPNVAAFVFPPILLQQPDPVITKRLWATFDQYRNAAALAPVEKVPLIEPIDPWTNKRYPPQVEVFQNQAIYVPPAPPLRPGTMVEPWIIRPNWQRWSQPDFYQNTALLVSTLPVLQPIPIFIWLNGPPVKPHDGIQYLYWRPTAGEIFLLSATGMTTIKPITVGPSPFVYTAPQNQLLLIGGGILTSVVYNGIYPPNAPAGFVTPPTSGTGFVLNYDSGNDLAIPASQGAILTITYTKIPSMWWVK